LTKTEKEKRNHVDFEQEKIVQNNKEEIKLAESFKEEATVEFKKKNYEDAYDL